MPQLDAFLKRDFFIENLLFHRARKLYFRMMSFLGKLTNAFKGASGNVRVLCQSPRYIPHPVTKVIPPFWETSSSRLSLVLLVLVGKTFPNQFPPWKFESPSGPSTSVVLAAGLATD